MAASKNPFILKSYKNVKNVKNMVRLDNKNSSDQFFIFTRGRNIYNFRI